MSDFVHVIPAKAGIQKLKDICNIYIKDLCNELIRQLDSSLRWNDMGNCYPDFETSQR
jgi:soluble cytochrome b562